MRNFLFALLAISLSVAPARAQLTAPYTFTNGTAANADEVNANFAKFLDALNRTGGTMTGTLTSRSVIPSADNTYDLGSLAAMFRTGYLKTSMIFGQTTANYILTWANPAAARAISIADPGGTDVFTFNAATQTLTNKTLTSPVLGGTVTGTYTLAGTPTITCTGCVTWTNLSKSGSSLADLATRAVANLSDGSNVALLNALNTFTASGSQTITGAATTQQGWSITNTSTGTLSYAGVTLTNSAAASAFLYHSSTGYTPSGDFLASGGLLGDDGAGGLSISARHASGALRFYSGGTTQRWGINAAGDFTFGASSHIADSSGTPTISSGPPVGSTIDGTDYAFTVVNSSNSAATGVINFGHTFTTAPVCVASVGAGSAGTSAVIGTVSTTQMQYSPNGTVPKVYVMCRGY